MGLCWIAKVQFLYRSRDQPWNSPTTPERWYIALPTVVRHLEWTGWWAMVRPLFLSRISGRCWQTVPCTFYHSVPKVIATTFTLPCTDVKLPTAWAGYLVEKLTSKLVIIHLQHLQTQYTLHQLLQSQIFVLILTLLFNLYRWEFDASFHSLSQTCLTQTNIFFFMFKRINICRALNSFFYLVFIIKDQFSSQNWGCEKNYLDEHFFELKYSLLFVLKSRKKMVKFNYIRVLP